MSVSDFDLIHELAARYGMLLHVLFNEGEPPLTSKEQALERAFNSGGAVGLVAALRAEMERERAAGEPMLKRAFGPEGEVPR